MVALITLARAKEAMPPPPPADDPLIDNLILAASAAIESRCRRTFSLATYDELHDGDGSGRLQLKAFPVVSLSRLATATRAALSISNTDASVQRATARLTATGLVLTKVAAGVETIDSSITWAGQPTLDAVATAVAALGAGWTATVASGLENWASLDLRPRDAAIVAAPRPGEFLIHERELLECRIELETGLVGGALPRGVGNIRAVYTAGFATIPDDVQQACALVVADWYSASKKDALLYRQWDGVTSIHRWATRALPRAAERLLASWRAVGA
ncbi:MAG TPA: hypothetical protein VNC50_10600 [Planctomycetia bacterium]|nr:hypothetical protein [Planctomycetia bacterium]